MNALLSNQLELFINRNSFSCAIEEGHTKVDHEEYGMYLVDQDEDCRSYAVFTCEPNVYQSVLVVSSLKSLPEEINFYLPSIEVINDKGINFIECGSKQPDNAVVLNSETYSNNHKNLSLHLHYCEFLKE